MNDVTAEDIEKDNPLKAFVALLPDCMRSRGRALIKGSTPGSKVRRVFSWLAIGMCGLLLAEALYFKLSPVSPLLVGIFISLSIAYFVTAIVSVIFLTSISFRVNPVRLTIDSLTSVVFTILSFALLYRFNGISISETCSEPVTDAATAIYFSTVTFTTLGYGDYRPCEAAQLWAAAQAIIGNLHLGVMVGAAFLLAGAEPPRSQRDKT